MDPGFHLILSNILRMYSTVHIGPNSPEIIFQRKIIFTTKSGIVSLQKTCTVCFNFSEEISEFWSLFYIYQKWRKILSSLFWWRIWIWQEQEREHEYEQVGLPVHQHITCICSRNLCMLMYAMYVLIIVHVLVCFHVDEHERIHVDVFFTCSCLYHTYLAVFMICHVTVF